jgi:hypothetical protein
LVRGAAQIDAHKDMYGRVPTRFEFLDELRPVCAKRLEQFGWYGHGNMGGD